MNVVLDSLARKDIWFIRRNFSRAKKRQVGCALMNQQRGCKNFDLKQSLHNFRRHFPPRRNCRRNTLSFLPFLASLMSPLSQGNIYSDLYLLFESYIITQNIIWKLSYLSKVFCLVNYNGEILFYLILKNILCYQWFDQWFYAYYFSFYMYHDNYVRDKIRKRKRKENAMVLMQIQFFS